MKLLKTIGFEAIWIISLLAISYLLVGFFLGFENINGQTYDISMHDTYIVGNLYQIILLLFIVLSFLAYGIKTFVLKMNNLFSNFIFVAFSIFITLIIWSLYRIIAELEISNNEWVIYPPLSVKESTYPPENLVSLFLNKLLYVGIITLLSIKNVFIIIVSIKKIIKTVPNKG